LAASTILRSRIVKVEPRSEATESLKPPGFAHRNRGAEQCKQRQLTYGGLLDSNLLIPFKLAFWCDTQRVALRFGTFSRVVG
jgi:hypothetical protein